MFVKTMVILDENMESKQMFQFETNKLFNVGDVIEHERLDGKHIVKFTDPATVQVRPFNDLGLVQNKDGSWEIDMSLL